MSTRFITLDDSRHRQASVDLEQFNNPHFFKAFMKLLLSALFRASISEHFLSKY